MVKPKPKPKPITQLLFLQGVLALLAAIIFFAAVNLHLLKLIVTNPDTGWIILYTPFLLLFLLSGRVQFNLYQFIWNGRQMSKLSIDLHRVLTILAGVVLGFVITYFYRTLLYLDSGSYFSVDTFIGLLIGLALFYPHYRLSSATK